MIVRSLDSNDDWTFGKGKSDYLSNNDAIAQNISTRLRSFVGDCFFDLDAGIDWWTLLGSKNITGLILSIRTLIFNTDNVTSLLELSANLDDNRNQSITYSVSTVYSTMEPVTKTVGVPTNA